MRTIWKYPLQFRQGSDVLTLELPSLHHLLTIQDQAGVDCLWVGVDPEAPAPPARIDIIVVCTGHPVPEGACYLSTIRKHGGDLVLHYFWKPTGA